MDYICFSGGANKKEFLFDYIKTIDEGILKRQIKKWADTCMEFVYEDLGYTQIYNLKDGSFIKTIK